MKDIIEKFGWEVKKNNIFIMEHIHFGEYGFLILKLRENFQDGTHITIRFCNEPTVEYLFQGWLLEEKEKGFKTLMEQLRIFK